MHTQLIATELSNLGFTTRITQTGVLVSLNRPVSSMEVVTVLHQVFEEIEFRVHLKVIDISKNSVHVSEE